MNPLLMAALILVLSHQGNLSITRLDSPKVTERTLAGGAVERTYWHGITWCELTETTGQPDRWRVAGIEYVPGVVNGTDNLTHEAWHAADCSDNGRVDGSLLPYKPTTDDPGHELIGWALAHEDEAIKILEKVR